jgi:RNA polymerase subunit RPABC4/transcription elongation factor Spt4
LDLGENLSNSFDLAKKLLSDIGRLVILIVLGIIPIVNWIVVGYAARVLKETPTTNTPPKLEKYGELFVDGAKLFFASLIYMLIPIILIAAGAASLLAGIVTLPGGMVTPLVALGGVGLVLLLVGIVIGIILLIILGVGWAHMLKTGKFGKAFAFGEILDIVKAIGWLKYLGWVVIIIIIAFVVGGLSGAIPYIGWILSAVVSPFLSVFSFRSLGLLYNDGAPPELRVQPGTAVARLACASCGAALQQHDKFCPNCGAAAPSPPLTPTPSTVEPTKFCTSCGAKISSSAQFCGSCGARQTQ